MCLPWLVAVAFAIGAPAQAGEPAWLKKTSRVTLHASVVPARDGGGFTLVLDVTPSPGLHVYAPGNEGYRPPALRLELPEGVRRDGPALFPDAQPLVFGDLKELVRVYGRTFRIRQPLAMARDGAERPPDGVRITGTLEYQACTPKICFPPQTEPFEAALPARRPAVKSH